MLPPSKYIAHQLQQWLTQPTLHNNPQEGKLSLISIMQFILLYSLTTDNCGQRNETLTWIALFGKS